MKWTEAETECATVTTEWPERMDIYVESPKRTKALAIENKLFGAVDQPQQVTRYFKAIADRQAGSSVVVYLSPGGEEPTEASIGKEDKEQKLKSRELLIWNAEKLREWLSDCALCNVAEPVRHFIEAFERFVERRLIGRHDHDQEQDMAEHIVDDPKRVGVFIEMLKLESTVKGMLLDKFRKDLETCATNSDLRVVDDWWNEMANSRDGFGLKRQTGADDDVSVIYEFGSPRARSLSYGVYAESRLKDDLEQDARRASLDKFLGKGMVEDNWLWWRYAPDHIVDLPRDWEHASQPWTMMAEGTLAPAIVSSTITILEAMEGIAPAEA